MVRLNHIRLKLVYWLCILTKAQFGLLILYNKIIPTAILIVAQYLRLVTQITDKKAVHII